jgi:putative nucleotidyltransferase with HDIG domain
VSAVAELVAAAPVRAVRGALDGGEARAWLVGGAVRDALLGRQLADLDLAVDGDPEAVARTVGAHLRGPVFALSESFGAWRALDGRRRFTVDVSPLQGSTIEEDLGRRDFTVNAMAVPLAGETSEPIDPHGGAADLEAGTLRVLGPAAYELDPLRPLRLVRFASQLGFAPDLQTARLTRAAAPRLGEPSPERVFAELRGLVLGDEVLDALELGRSLGVLGAVLPELEPLGGLEQSRFHHRDVWGHTLEVLQHAIELVRDPVPVFGDELGAGVAAVLSQPLADGLTRGEALRLGALMHDIAKPQTRGEREDGRVTFIGHDAAGEELSAAILRRLRTSEALRSYVGRLTRHHLALGFLVHERPLTSRALHAYLRRCEPVEVEVTVLSCADRLATRAEGQEPWIEGHLDVAREVMGPALRWRAQGPPRPPLRGDELASELGIALGPEVGRLLAELEGAVFAGEVSTREQAVVYARRVRENR